MNKIKQNKITFSLILVAIFVTFSSLTFLSLPVLFKYKSKAQEIEKNFYNNFKIYLNIFGKISYKPFPKPHLLVEKASLNLKENNLQNDLIKTNNFKIYISLRDLYLRSFKNLISAEITNSNLNFNISDLEEIRTHLYEKINNPINFKNIKLFLKNKNNEVILISPIKNISYKINNKTKDKFFTIDGKLFGIKFKSGWKRNYRSPKTSTHNIKLVNPNIEINNVLKFENAKNFTNQILILSSQERLEYKVKFNNDKIKISSPDNPSLNFKVNSNIQINPFYFTGSLLIKNKKVENIIDYILLKLMSYDENYLGNLNGSFKIKFNELNNKLLKSGEISLNIKEKKINLKESRFNLGKIGTLKTKIKFIEKEGEIIFFSNNMLDIINHIEFAKIFQIGSNKAKNINRIYFDLKKNIGDNQITISNVRINSSDNNVDADNFFIIKNIQNLRASIRKIID